MKRIIVTLIFLIFTVSTVKAENRATVMIDSLSVRNQPDGEIVKTLNKRAEIFFKNRYRNWINSINGWLNSDFTKLFPQSDFLYTERIEGNFALLKEKAEGTSLYGREALEESRVFPLIEVKNNIAVIDENGKKVAVSVKYLKIEKGVFPAGIILKNGTLISEKGKILAYVKRGTPFMKFGNFIAVNGKFGNFIPVKPENSFISVSNLITKINVIIDTFNSARVSSAITERLGYFPKVLPLTPEDVEIVNLEENRKGMFINLKYMFYNLEGSEMKDRRTRLILKRGNEIFWEKVVKEGFKISPSVKFVQLNILRYNGKGDFEKKGFVALGVTDFKNGVCDVPPEKFIEKTESELSEDLWFFANEVYERVENGN